MNVQNLQLLLAQFAQNAIRQTCHPQILIAKLYCKHDDSFKVKKKDDGSPPPFIKSQKQNASL